MEACLDGMKEILVKYFVLLDEVDENEISSYIEVACTEKISYDDLQKVYKAYLEEKDFDKKQHINMGVQVKRVIVYKENGKILLSECIGKPRKYKNRIKITYYSEELNEIKEDWIDYYKRKCKNL